MADIRIIAVGAALLLTQVPAQPSAVLTGSVVRLNSSTPVAGARIVAARVGGALTDYRTVTADDRGQFAIRDIGAGSYRVFAEHEQYLQAEYGKRLTGLSGTPVTLTAGQTTGPIVIAMTPPGVITGRVLDKDRPARLVTVRALKRSVTDGQAYFTIGAWAQTDDRGEYRLFGLAPGAYVVSAMLPSPPRIVGGEVVTPVMPSNANNNRGAVNTPLAAETVDLRALDFKTYPAVYHPGTLDIAQAQALQVGPGAVLQAAPLALTAVATFTIRGRLIPPGGTTLPASMSVVALPVITGTNLTLRAVEAKDGVFELPAVPPGQYRLRATTPGAALAGLAGVTPAIDVIDRNLDNVDIPLVAPVQITGRVTIDGRVPAAADGTIGVQLYGSTMPSPGSVLRLQPDGTFALPTIFPGEYLVRTIGGVGRTFWVKTAMFGSEDVTVHRMRIESDVRGRTLDITLGEKAATINVQVLDASKRPVSGVLVVAVPDPARRERSSYYKTATTDAEGRARLEGVPPGEYRVFSSGEIEAGAWQDPDVLRLHEARGELIRVAEGGSATITIRILQ